MIAEKNYTFDDQSQPLTNKVNALFAKYTLNDCGNTLVTLMIWYISMASNNNLEKANKSIDQLSQFFKDGVKIQIEAELATRQ